MLTAPVSVDERSVNTAVDANGRASLPKQTETPWQSDNDRSGETIDIDGTDNGLDDSSADNPSGNDPHSRRFDVVRCPNRREISHLTP